MILISTVIVTLVLMAAAVKLMTPQKRTAPVRKTK